MAKRAATRPTKPTAEPRRAKAKAALDAVIEAVHEGNRMLEGEELVKAVYEVFGLVRPESSFEDSK